MIERELLTRLVDWATAPLTDVGALNALLKDTKDVLAAGAIEGAIAQEVVFAPPPGLGEALVMLHNDALRLAGRAAMLTQAIAPELVEDERTAAGEPLLPLETDHVQV